MKRKVKIFRAKDVSLLEKAVNEFVVDKMIINIQLQTTLVNEGFRIDGTPVSCAFYDTVMVTYWEVDNAD